MFLGLADFPTSEPVYVVGPLGATFLCQRATHLRADPLVSRGASSSSVPPPPSSTGAAETSGATVATDVPPPTTLDDSDIRRTLDHVLIKFWWTFWMRLEVCEQIWHSFGVLHCYLLLMMDFDCPLALRHKKGEYI